MEGEATRINLPCRITVDDELIRNVFPVTRFGETSFVKIVLGRPGWTKDDVITVFDRRPEVVKWRESTRNREDLFEFPKIFNKSGYVDIKTTLDHCKKTRKEVYHSRINVFSLGKHTRTVGLLSSTCVPANGSRHFEVIEFDPLWVYHVNNKLETTMLSVTDSGRVVKYRTGNKTVTISSSVDKNN